MRNFRELKVWQRAHGLTLAVYHCARKFPRDEIYGLTSQMRRSAASIGANLAEGCGRQTGPEMARFVRLSMGSASELEYHLLLAKDLGYVVLDEWQPLQRKLTEIRKMLTGLLQSIETENPTQEQNIKSRAAALKAKS